MVPTTMAFLLFKNSMATLGRKNEVSTNAVYTAATDVVPAPALRLLCRPVK